MKKDILSIKKYRILISVLLAAGVLLALFFAVITASLYEKDVHYFRLYSSAPKVYTVLMCVFCAVSLATLFTVPKASASKESLSHNKRKKPVVIAAFICAAAVAASVVSRFFKTRTEVPQAMQTPFAKPQVLRVLLIIFGIVSVVFFLSMAFKLKYSVSAYLAFGVIAYFIVYILTIYYDTTIPINSPMRVINQITTITMLLWIMLEERFLIGTSKPFLYVAMGLITSSFCFALSFSAFAGTVSGKIDPNTFAIVGAVQALAFGIYTSVRIVSFVFSFRRPKKKHIPPEEPIKQA